MTYNIEELINNTVESAKIIQNLFMASYQIEADLVGARNFPPLHRTLDQYIQSNTTFHGCYVDDQLGGIVELQKYPSYLSINSLVVHPDHFRKGIGKILTQYAIDQDQTGTVMVETAKDNIPAITLYESVGFTKIKTWMTDHDIIKCRFQLKKQAV